jgi:diguanylate cyclase (GGDEF)-like protein
VARDDRPSRLRRLLDGRDDAEQALVRVAVVVAAAVLLYTLDGGPDPRQAGNLLLGRRLVLLSLAITFLLVIATFVKRMPAAPRRLVGIAHDVSFLSFAMFLGEAQSAPYAALYLLVALGNGFRFGPPYMYFAAGSSVIGFGAVYLASAYWREEDMLSINILVVLVVIPFYTGRLLDSLQRAKDRLAVRAARDTLTGLLSRAEFDARVSEAIADIPGEHVLLFCDLDHFKIVNDEAGHAAGDKMLIDVASLIERSVGGNDLCGRQGGDEFCVLLTGSTLDKAREVAERIRSRVAGYRLAWGNAYFSVGISIGVAPASAVSDTSSLVRLADAAAYAAKNAGRNQIHVVDPRVDDVDTAQVRRLHTKPDRARKPEAR